jgi:NitT/TauT family transport system ATP-binding protein
MVSIPAYISLCISAKLREPILYVTIDDVGLTFRKNGCIAPVLERMCLSVDRSSFVSLVGASGSGKTSILNLVAGLLQPTSGRILINAMTPEEALKERKIGFVFQHPVLFGWRTVLENVQLTGELLHRPDVIERTRDYINLVGLTSHEGKYPYELSGGMQSRVAIARALVHQPDLLLMDEPFADLDELTREWMNLELLRIWRETKTTVIFVTHSLEEAVFLSDTVYVLGGNPGHVIEKIDIGLPRPRMPEVIETPAFQETLIHARKVLRADVSKLHKIKGDL